MAGSDAPRGWHDALLTGALPIPIVSVRDGVVREINDAAGELFQDVHPGTGVEALVDESCRSKLRDFLRAGVSGASVELEVARSGRPPIPCRFLLLSSPDEQLLVGASLHHGFTEDAWDKLMDANTDMANLTRELSRRMSELDRARDALQKLVELRETFLSALAHDLKGPLSVILLSEGLLRQKSSALHAADVQRHVAKVERSARRMLDLVDSVLFTVHLDLDGALSPELLEELSVGELAREIALEYAPLAEESGIRLAVDVGEPVRARAHRAWLGQVFANLISNALRHAPPGTRVGIQLTRDGSRARCAVADEGPGVLPEDREAIFDRLVQRGGRSGSLGLGLYLCRRIVKLHGGHIWVEDNPGGGARFVFTIPAVSPDPDGS